MLQTTKTNVNWCLFGNHNHDIQAAANQNTEFFRRKSNLTLGYSSDAATGMAVVRVFASVDGDSIG